MADRKERVTLDCGCVAEIDLSPDGTYGYGGEYFVLPDSPDGGRITQTCTTHAATTKEK